MSPSGIKPTTFKLVGRCLNQLRYSVPLFLYSYFTTILPIYAHVLQVVSFHPIFQPKRHTNLSLTHTCHVHCPSRPPLFARANNTCHETQIMKLPIVQFSPSPCHFLPLRSKRCPQHPILNTISPFSSLNVTQSYKTTGTITMKSTSVKIQFSFFVKRPTANSQQPLNAVYTAVLNAQARDVRFGNFMTVSSGM